jgi:hypothetical protein
MDKIKIFQSIKEKIDIFCHRNLITSELIKSSRIWRVIFDISVINIYLSKDFMTITIFAVVLKNINLDIERKIDFYESILRANANISGPAFSLSPSNEVLLTYTRSIEDLDYNELSYLILSARKTIAEYSNSLCSFVSKGTQIKSPNSDNFKEAVSLIAGGSEISQADKINILEKEVEKIAEPKKIKEPEKIKVSKLTSKKEISNDDEEWEF